MTAGFQTAVSVLQAPAVAGDWASENPRASVNAGPGGLVAGAAGVYVGRFGWRDPGNLQSVLNTGFGAPTGFIDRRQQGLNTTYLLDASMFIPAGFGMTLMKEGDYWVVNDGSSQAQPGQTAFANFADGKVTFGSAATKTGALTGAITAQTFSVTGSITDNVMTVTAVGSGTVVAGGTISGTGVASGSKVVRQLTGTTCGIGTYEVSIAEQSAASTTISGTYGLLTVTVASASPLAVGMSLTDGTGAVVGTQVTQLGTGTGGTGTYIVDNNTAVSSTADIQFATNVATKWKAETFGLAGELVKITSWPNG